MKWILLLSLLAFAVAKECALDAVNDTEWQLEYQGRVYDAGASRTIFSYAITTLSDSQDVRCTAKNCQGLSHWVLITKCDGAQSSPDASYGRDGQWTMDGDEVVGYKWELDESSVGLTLYYTLTVSGNVPEGEVSYLVKGGQRCGTGTTMGPVSCDQQPEPDCVNDSDCDDGIHCTENMCVSGVCQYTPRDEQCAVDGSCILFECQPGSLEADANGCVQVDFDHSVCAEHASCANNFCDPEDPRADERSCVVQHLDSRCEDDYACTLNECVPSDPAADSETGCRITYRHDECQDGASCSDNTCDPTSLNADANGCSHTFFDDRCEDDYSCTLNECMPSHEDSDPATGCHITYQHDECDDGASCSDNTCDPDNAVAGDLSGCANDYFDDRCEDDYSCTLNECMPSNEDSDSATGCHVTYQHDECEDGASCSDNTCDPDNAAPGDMSGCANQYFDDRCEDDYSCTLNECMPSNEDSDSATGCHVTYQHDECDDGASCSDNVCDPDNADAGDMSGCAHTYFDHRCDDLNVCSNDYCRPEASTSVATGCMYEPNNSPCDDGDECTGTIELPDECDNFECLPGDIFCPYRRGFVLAGQFYPAGEVMLSNNETHLVVRWWAGDSGWEADEFHIYVGVNPPDLLAPGTFPVEIQLTEGVTELTVVIPLPDACNLDPIYFAFHLVAHSIANSPICIEREDGNIICSGLTETGWLSGQYSNGGSWATFTDFDTCCCEGFSHFDLFLELDVEVLFSPHAKSASKNSAESLLAGLLDTQPHTRFGTSDTTSTATWLVMSALLVLVCAML